MNHKLDVFVAYPETCSRFAATCTLSSIPMKPFWSTTPPRLWGNISPDGEGAHRSLHALSIVASDGGLEPDRIGGRTNVHPFHL